MFKNVAGQFVIVYARDKSTGAEKTGDAANITARSSKDSVDSAASNDVNPTEISNTTQKGQYAFLISQGESNCDLLGLTAVSSTTDIELLPVFIYTRTPIQAAVAAELDTAIPELASLPVTPTLRQAIMLPYMGVRNKRDTTASSDEIHNSAGGVVVTATVSDDDVTYSKGKYA